MTARAPAHGRLLFDALGKQATIGPCNEPRPSMFDPVAKARYNAWKQLGNLSRIEATRTRTRTRTRRTLTLTLTLARKSLS